MLDRFAEVGLIDDAALADAVRRSPSTASGGWPARAVAAKLRQRGVPTSDVDRRRSAQLDRRQRAASRRRAGRSAGCAHCAAPTARRAPGGWSGLLARKGYAPGPRV